MHAIRQVKGDGLLTPLQLLAIFWSAFDDYDDNLLQIFMRMMNHGLAIVWPAFDDYDDNNYNTYENDDPCRLAIVWPA